MKNFAYLVMSLWTEDDPDRTSIHMTSYQPVFVTLDKAKADKAVEEAGTTPIDPEWHAKNPQQPHTRIPVALVQEIELK